MMGISSHSDALVAPIGDFHVTLVEAPEKLNQPPMMATKPPK